MISKADSYETSRLYPDTTMTPKTAKSLTFAATFILQS